MIIEQPFAIDIATRTVRRLEKRGHREYAPTSPTEFFGTVDRIDRLKDTGIWCATDWKTGLFLEGIDDRMQLKFFTTAIHLETGASVVEGRYGYITESGRHFWDKHTFGLLDFEDTLDALTTLHGRIQLAHQLVNDGGVPNLRTGAHCTYCPAYNVCPAKAGLVKRMLPDIEAVAAQIALMTPANVGIAYSKYQELSSQIEKLGKIFKEYAHSNDVPLPNGKTLKVVESSTSRMNTTHLAELARKLGASDADIESCRKTSYFTKLQQVSTKAKTG